MAPSATRSKAPKASEVTVRSILPAPAVGTPENTQMLYRAVPQIEDPSQLKVEFKMYAPEDVPGLLLMADSDPEFKQRPLKERDVKRWRLLMETGRFVNYLPNGPLCFDPDGMLLNGKHRLTALGRQDRPFGFMVVRNVPRWMFQFFDTMRVRSLNDVFHMAGRMSKAQTGSTMRLGMRYEEFLHGMRPALGWRHWGTERDEHFDVDSFLTRREDLGDLYVAAEQAARGSRLIVASLMVFRFYQQLAWPDGDTELTAFWDGLAKGAMLAPNSPALVLREWARDNYKYKERIHGKRELHLLLLNRMFALSVQGDKVQSLNWAHGFAMTVPYHPDGPEMAVKNILTALDETDLAAA